MILQKTRKSEISALNVFLCLLVIFIHVSSAPVTSYVKSSFQYAAVFFPWRLAGFAVQGFIFLGGLRFFLNKENTINYKTFYKTRFMRIVIPYLIWNAIFYLFFIIKGYFPFSVSDFTFYVLKGDLVSPFYFVIVIVQFYALAPFWRWLVAKANIPVALLVSAAVTLLLGQFLPELVRLVFPQVNFRYNDRVFTTYVFYWLTGCYAGVNYEKARKLVKQFKKLIITAFIILMLSEGILSYISFSGIRYIPWLENVHFLYCVGAVLFFFTLFTLIFEDRPIKSKLLIEADRASYLIFLSHCFVLFIINDMMRLMGITSISVAYGIRILTVYSITITMCILWNRLKSKKLRG